MDPEQDYLQMYCGTLNMIRKEKLLLLFGAEVIKICWCGLGFLSFVQFIIDYPFFLFF